MKKYLVASLLLIALCGTSQAQTPAYPSRQVTLVVTSVPGGVTDVVGRALAQALSKDWGQEVIVENKGGAAHIIGAEAVAKAAPDGYTLLVGESGTFTVNPTLLPKDKVPYDADKDFTPITGLVRIYQSIFAAKSLPVSNTAELIALAKQKPGQITYGTAGVGSALHMNMALFDSMAGVKMVRCIIAARRRRSTISSAITSIPWWSASRRACRLTRPARSRCSASARRNGCRWCRKCRRCRRADCPATRRPHGSACSVRPACRKDIVTKIDQEVIKIFSDPAFRARFLDPQMFESMAGPPDEFAAYIKAERAKWAKVIHDDDIKIQ